MFMTVEGRSVATSRLRKKEIPFFLISAEHVRSIRRSRLNLLNNGAENDKYSICVRMVLEKKNPSSEWPTTMNDFFSKSLMKKHKEHVE